MKYNIYFLHGFLGQAQDFSRTIQLLESSNYNVNCIAHSLLSPKTSNQFSPQLSLKQWVSNFNDYVVSKTNPNEKNILIGYSMGGRLALHLVFSKESLWDNVFALSSHPGFLSLEETESRKSWQQEWVKKLGFLSWENFTKEWNNQKIFSGDKPNRNFEEVNFSKESLSNALCNWSLTEHYFPKSFLNNSKVNWVVGYKDKKYFDLYSNIEKERPSFNFKVFSSGHRTFNNSEDIFNLLIDKVFSETSIPSPVTGEI